MIRNGRLFKKQLDSVRRMLMSRIHEGKHKQKLFKLIPRRINRTPTDILRVLSFTVDKDQTAFHYHIPDDPFFYPRSNFQKKTRLMAIESGRKSARWIVENNSGFFNHNLAEPSIKTFLNKPVFDENSEVTEEVLLDFIQNRNVTQAVTCYKLLQNKGLGVTKETKQSLLELVCFYNGNERQDERDLFGKWYEVDRKKKQEKISTWKDDDGFVKELFDSLDPDCPLAYSALIQGMIKHNNLEEAMETFAIGSEIKVKFSVGVYNLLIENVPNFEKDPFKQFEAIETYLTQMAKKEIRPNLGTLNSVLNALSRLDGISLSQVESFVCKLLVEFEDLKIYPSLGSYYYLLKIFACRDEVFRTRIAMAWSVMNCVTRKRWTIKHPSDLSFFTFAMSLFSIELKNVKLAETLMNFYSNYDHYKLVNTNFEESQFFDQYLYAIFRLAPLERSMEVYRKFVPSQVFLDFRRYELFVKIIVQQKKFDYLEEVWRDMSEYLPVHFSKMTTTIDLIIQQVSHFKKEETPKYFYEASEVLLKLLDTAHLESETLKNMLIVFIRFEDENKISDLMNFIIERNSLFIEAVPLDETFAFAVSKKNIPLIKNCLELCYRENNLEKLKSMAKKTLPLLNEPDKSWLNAILKKAEEQFKKLVSGGSKMNSEKA